MEKLKERSYEYYEEVNPALVKHITSDALVLDVGCGYGALGETIKSKNNYVVGLELDEKAIEVSRNRLDEVYKADIVDFENLPESVKNKKFDVIVFADVLEHVYDPFSMLKNYQGLLKPRGKIIVSIPNVVVWDIRLKFLFGIFSYTDTGICDRTHIRFFTLSSMKRLLSAASLKIIKKDFNPGLFRPFVPFIKKVINSRSKNNIYDPRAILENPVYKLYMKLIFPLEKMFCEIFKELFAFQFIFITERK